MTGREARRDGPAGTLVLRKARDILACFDMTRPVLSLSEIQEGTGLPYSTCQRLVQHLLGEGFLDRDPGGHGLRVGMELLRLAAPATADLDLAARTREALRTLRDETGESSCLFVRSGANRTIIALERCRHPVARIMHVGMVMPLDSGSAGTTFLAFDPGAREDLERSLPAGEGRTPPAWEAKVGRAREQGWAASFEERQPGVSSLSAPVFGFGAELVAVIGIGSPIQRVNPQTLAQFVPAIVRAGQAASAACGHTGTGT